MELPEDPDYSLLKGSVGPSSNGANDIAMLLIKGTDEVRQVVINECDLIYECKVCRNLFRSVVNFLAHKRLFCQERYHCSQQSFHKDPGMSLSREPGVSVSISPSPPPSTPPPVIPVGKPSIESIVSNLSASQGKSIPSVTSIPTKYSKRLLSRKRNHDIRSILNKEPRIYLKPISGVSAAMFQSTTPSESDQEEKIDDIIHEISNKKRKRLENVSETSNFDAVSDTVNVKCEEPDLCSVYSCDKCLEQFEEQSLLDTHVEKDHEVERTVFTCPICTMMFLSIGGCVKHLLKIHKKKKHQRERLRLVIRNRSYTKVLSPSELSQLKNRSTLSNKLEEVQLSDKLEEDLKLSEMLGKEELSSIQLKKGTYPPVSEENEQPISSQQEDMLPLSTLMKRYKYNEEEEELPISNEKDNKLPPMDEKVLFSSQDKNISAKEPGEVIENFVTKEKEGKSSIKEVKELIKEGDENFVTKERKVIFLTKEDKEKSLIAGKGKMPFSNDKVEKSLLILTDVKSVPIKIVEEPLPNEINDKILTNVNDKTYICKKGDAQLVSSNFLFSNEVECLPPSKIDEAQPSYKSLFEADCKNEVVKPSPKFVEERTATKQEELQHLNIYRKQIHREAVYVNKVSTKMMPSILDCRKCGQKLLTSDTVSSQLKRCMCRPIKEEPTKKIEIQIRKDYKKDVSTTSSMASNNNSSPSNPKLTNEILMELRKVCNFKSLTCIPCERKYQTSHILKRHIAQHIGWTRFTCATCSFRTYEKYQCLQHCIAAHEVSENEALDLIIDDQRLEIGLRQLKNESVDLKPDEILGSDILMSDGESFVGKSSMLDSLKESDVQKSEGNYHSLEPQSILNDVVINAEQSNVAASREVPTVKEAKKTITIKTVTVKPSDVKPLEVANCNTRNLNVLSIKEIVHLKKLPKQDLEKLNVEDSLSSLSNVNN